MADEQLQIRVVVDNSQIPAAMAATRAQVNSVTAGLNEVGQAGENSGKRVKEAMDKSTYSITEARLAARGLGQEIGISVNREVSRFLATSSTIGPILSKAFSVIAVVGIIEILVEAVEKINDLTAAFEGFGEVQRKEYDDAVSANIKQIALANDLANARLKLSAIGLEGNEKQAADLRALTQEYSSTGKVLGEYEKMLEKARAEVENTNPALAKYYETLGKNTAGGVEYNRALKSMGELEQEVAEMTKATNDAQVARDRGRREAAAEALRIARATAAATIEGDRAIGEARIRQQEQIAKGLHDVGVTSDEDYIAQQKDLEDSRYADMLNANGAELRLLQVQGSAKAADAERLSKKMEADEISHNTKLREIQDAADTQWRAERIRALADDRSMTEDSARAEIESIRKAAEERAKAIEARAGPAAPGVTGVAAGTLQQELAVTDRLMQAEIARGEALRALHVEEDKPEYQAHIKAEIALLNEEKRAQQEYAAAVARVNDANLAQTRKFIDGVGGALSGAVVSWANEQETFGRAMQQVWRNLADAAIKALIQMAVQALISAAVGKAAAVSEKEAWAADAAVKAGNAVANIPIVGPVLAPVAAWTVFGALMAFERGGIMPTTNLALLHKNEMVLPAHISQALQAGAMGGHTFNYQPVIHGASNVDTLARSGRQFVSLAMRELRRMNK